MADNDIPAEARAEDFKRRLAVRCAGRTGQTVEDCRAEVDDVNAGRRPEHRDLIITTALGMVAEAFRRDGVFER